MKLSSCVLSCAEEDRLSRSKIRREEKITAAAQFLTGNKKRMAQALATPVVPSVSLICSRSANPNSFSTRLSFPVLSPPKVNGASASFSFTWFAREITIREGEVRLVFEFYLTVFEAAVLYFWVILMKSYACVLCIWVQFVSPSIVVKMWWYKVLLCALSSLWVMWSWVSFLPLKLRIGNASGDFSVKWLIDMPYFFEWFEIYDQPLAISRICSLFCLTRAHAEFHRLFVARWTEHQMCSCWRSGDPEQQACRVLPPVHPRDWAHQCT